MVHILGSAWEAASNSNGPQTAASQTDPGSACEPAAPTLTNWRRSGSDRAPQE